MKTINENDKKLKEYLKKQKKEISEFKSRKIYKKLSLKVLATISDDKLEQTVVDYIRTKILNYQTILDDVSNLSPSFQMVYSTWVLENEVNNGGFNQFFYNSSGQFTEMALRSLKMINALEYYQIVETAVKIYIKEKDNLVLQNLYSQRTLQAFSESYKLTSLDECDNAFFKLDNNLGKLRLQYIRSHLESFVGN